MEKRISAKTRLYFQNFKDILKDKIVKDAKLNPNDMNDLVQFIYDYPQYFSTRFSKEETCKILFHSLKDVVLLGLMENNCTRRKKDHLNFVEHTLKEFHTEKLHKQKHQKHIQENLLGTRN